MQPLWPCMHFSEWLLSNTLCHMTSRIIVWDHLFTVFAANFPVRIHVSLELTPTFARFVTFLTYHHTIIMLVLHVLIEMFFQKELHSYTWHKQAWRLQICTIGNDALCVKEIIFPYQKENLLRKKRYVLNLVCFESGIRDPRWKWDNTDDTLLFRVYKVKVIVVDNGLCPIWSEDTK